MGAWIETSLAENIVNQRAVAPYVGAWIETEDVVVEVFNPYGSHPMWVRGLKRIFSQDAQAVRTSHPMWVRGLKHGGVCGWHQQGKSHPMWVRGLKLDTPF